MLSWSASPSWTAILSKARGARCLYVCVCLFLNSGFLVYYRYRNEWQWWEEIKFNKAFDKKPIILASSSAVSLSLSLFSSLLFSVLLFFISLAYREAGRDKVGPPGSEGSDTGGTFPCPISASYLPTYRHPGQGRNHSDTKGRKRVPENAQGGTIHRN
jgi:ABC-type Fe3+ transport system permease subunit